MPEPDPSPRAPAAGLRLLDLAGLVVGYGLAALLVRTFWPEFQALGGARGVGLCLFYAWFGLAMSGPAVLLLDRRGPAAPSPIPSTDAASRYSNDEMGWIAIGGYLIVVTLLVVPVSRGETRSTVALVAEGAVAVALAVLLVIDRRVRRKRPPSPPRWTQRAGRFVLRTCLVPFFILILLLN